MTSPDDTLAGPYAADVLWCTTCQADHVPVIPVVTWCCADCAFGCWGEATAEGHAARFPEHVVYPVIHVVTAP